MSANVNDLINQIPQYGNSRKRMLIGCAAVLCQTDIHRMAGKEKQAYENQY